MTNHTSAAGRASESLRRPDHCNRRNTSSVEKKITLLSTLALMMQLGLSGKESFRSCMKISADMMVMIIMLKGKFKKFYEDFHRAKSLIAFLSQKTACPVYLFQATSSSPHKSNKTSVFQVMSTDHAVIWNILANSLKSIIDSVKIEPGTILFSFPTLSNKCPEKENSVSTLSFGWYGLQYLLVIKIFPFLFFGKDQ